MVGLPKRKRVKQGESDGRYKVGKKHGETTAMHAACMAAAEGWASQIHIEGHASGQGAACAQQVVARWRSGGGHHFPSQQPLGSG
jgi:hypothetical protein